MDFNHFDREGRAVMVDVSGKSQTVRTATAEGTIRVSREVLDAIIVGTAAKGDVLGVARVAGIMAVKRTPDLIPLCHPLPVAHAAVTFDILEEELSVRARCTVKLTGQTGVEMEALTGVTAALLTVYDMCKAIDRGLELTGIHLLRKEGGKSGIYQRR